jgi:beta-glucosidase
LLFSSGANATGADGVAMGQAGRVTLPRALSRLSLVGTLAISVACNQFAAVSWSRAPADASGPTAQRVDALLSQMTLAEKVGQMDQILVDHVTSPANSVACPGCFGDPDPAAMASVLVDNGVGSILAGGTDMPFDTTHSGGTGNTGRDWAVTYNTIQSFAIQHSRLHIPVLFGIDAVHGFSHPVDAPLFQHGMGMGATWDTDAAEREGNVTGAALRATGWVEDFAPVQDVYRDNRWGRAYEPWSEEPVLAGMLGAAEVRGLQEPDSSNPLGVAATIKHFAGNSESINGHDRVEGQFGIRYLQDTFLPAYKEAIDAGAKMVMISSSSINGVPATGSLYLQSTLLRQRLGFQGVTISDYKDVQALATTYHVAVDSADAIAQAVNAGLDMAMWVDEPEAWQSAILQDVQTGKISQARIDEAVRRILTLKFELGLFDEPCVADPNAACLDPDAANRAVENGRAATLQSARESITLLKSTNNVLPLPTSAKLVVAGSNADSMLGQLGGWSVSWQGLAGSGHNCCEAPRGMIPPGTTVLGALRAADPNVLLAETDQAAVTAAANADAIIDVVGELGYAEGLGDNPVPELTADQKAMLADLESTGKPVVVVVLAGRPLGLGVTNEQNASAIVMGYQGSTETGQAVADVLFGVVNPSGKMPVSWPRDFDQPKFFDQLPSTAAGPGSSYDPLFTFGFGMSYTAFNVSDLTAVAPSNGGASISAALTVANVGNREGTEVVPLFVEQPTAPVTVPTHRLVGFTRVNLAAGESRSITLLIPASRLAVTPGDIDSTAAPVVIPGTYVLEVPTGPTPDDLFPSGSPPLRAQFVLNT